jgi:hypothetical protein
MTDIEIQATALQAVEIYATIFAVSDVTRILEALAQGDCSSADELLPLVYQDLRKLAALKMAGQVPGHTHDMGQGQWEWASARSGGLNKLATGQT